MNKLLSYKIEIQLDRRVKPLLDMCSVIGVPVFFVEHMPPCNHEDSHGSFIHGHAAREFFNVQQAIIIKIIEDGQRIGFKQILDSLAHEYRHAWQKANGKFSSIWYSALDAGPRNFIAAVNSERDAIKFARKYCSLYFDDPFKIRYDYSSMYQAYMKGTHG